MSAAPDVPPALSVVGWQSPRRPTHPGPHYRHPAHAHTGEQVACEIYPDGLLVVEDVPAESYTDPQVVPIRSDDDKAALRAYANAALPDGDPRKITRSMVADLNFCVGIAFFAVPRTPTVAGALPAGAEYVARAHRALQVLRALLPPEGP